VTTDLWQPRSACDTTCLPTPGSTPTVPILVRAGRLLAVAALVLAGAALLPVLPLVSARGRSAIGRRWAGALLRALGVRLVIRGRRPTRRALLVSNHVSWLDIPVMLKIAPARMLAKREVRDWPVIGWLAAAAGTVFIDRSRPKRLPRTVAEVAATLRQGAVVAVFPEGTTRCGTAAGRFRPAMFQAAIDAGAMVVPVRLTFRLSDGESTSIAAFLGEDTLWASLRRVLRVRGLVIGATVAPALHPDTTATRCLLARVAESAVGMSPAHLPKATHTVDRPQPTADISAVKVGSTVELDSAAELDLAA
jgi:1-acyl-sn-glycerol-3-phosphate acyltransferase